MSFSSPGIQRRWKSLPGEPVGDAGDPYTGYDRFGRTEAMRWIKPLDGGFNPLVNVQWGYSPSSQKTWRKDNLAPPSTAQDQKFNYDQLYQVTQRQRGVLNTNLTSTSGIPAQQEDFTYDETGNWKAYQQSNNGALSIDQSRVNNKSNQITQVDGSSGGISYDPNGNMLTVPTGEDLTGPSRRIVWGAWNRPVRVYNTDDNLIAEYQYDGVGRLTTVTSGGSTRHTYYDDQWRCVEERIDGTTTAERQHVWQPNNRWEMILRDRSTTNNGTMDERLYPMKDQLDPVAVCDASGNVLERYTYTAFGLPTFLDVSFNPQSSSYAWNFLFHAEFQDADTDWFNYGYRYYIPTLGRWPSRDPIGERGGRNLYWMARNRSVSHIDYLGLADVNNAFRYMWNWADKNPYRNAENDFERYNIMVRDGCIGLTCLEINKKTIGTKILDGRIPCFDTLPHAKQIAERWMKDKKCCSQGEKDLNGKSAQPRLISLHFWDTGRANNGVDDTPVMNQQTGQTNMSKVNWRGRLPNESPFDVGYMNDIGNMVHADHGFIPGSNPTNIFTDTLNEWRRKINDLDSTKRDPFNKEVWCVACNDSEYASDNSHRAEFRRFPDTTIDML